MNVYIREEFFFSNCERGEKFQEINYVYKPRGIYIESNGLRDLNRIGCLIPEK